MKSKICSIEWEMKTPYNKFQGKREMLLLHNWNL